MDDTQSPQGLFSLQNSQIAMAQDVIRGQWASPDNPYNQRHDQYMKDQVMRVALCGKLSSGVGVSPPNQASEIREKLLLLCP